MNPSAPVLVTGGTGGRHLVSTRADVAERLVRLASALPAGAVPDLAGPEVTDAARMIREYLRARGRRRAVVPLRLPRTRVVRDGGLLPGPGHVRGARTWPDFLAAETGR